VLSANEAQTIYPIYPTNVHEGAISINTSFPTTYVGGTISNLRKFPSGPPFLIGCIENLLINGQWVNNYYNFQNKIVLKYDLIFT